MRESPPLKKNTDEDTFLAFVNAILSTDVENLNSIPGQVMIPNYFGPDAPRARCAKNPMRHRLATCVNIPIPTLSKVNRTLINTYYNAYQRRQSASEEGRGSQPHGLSVHVFVVRTCDMRP